MQLKSKQVLITGGNSFSSLRLEVYHSLKIEQPLKLSC